MAKMLQYRIPVRPYKSFKEFLDGILTSASNRSKRQYPCLPCDGRGQWLNPADRDCIEGFKLVPLTICPHCKGTGETTRERYKSIYEDEIGDWRRDVKRNKIKNRAIGKLTPTERKVLGLV